MPLRTTPLHPLFAAEVDGLDLSLRFGASVPFGDATALALRGALKAHRLLVFRDQRLSPAEQVALTRAFGAPELHAVAGLRSPGRPEIVLETGGGDANGRGGFGLGDVRWHADLSWTQRPNRVSALHARSLPPAGGATLFADQCAAFDRLDPWLAHRARFLEAEHDPALRFSEGSADAAPSPVTHPVVRVDPDTGQCGLFVDEDTTTRLLGVPEPEAARLLQRLRAAATDLAVTYRHEWRPGDLVLWDNHAVLHRAEPRAAGRGWRMRRTMAAAAGRLRGPAEVAQAWVVAGWPVGRARRLPPPAKARQALAPEVGGCRRSSALPEWDAVSVGTSAASVAARSAIGRLLRRGPNSPGGTGCLADDLADS